MVVHCLVPFLCESLLISFRSSLEPDIMTPITHHLGQRLTSPDSDPAACRVLRKSLRALNAILKELSHIKMMTSVKTLGQVCNHLAHHLLTMTSNSSVSAHCSYSLPTFWDLCSINPAARPIHLYCKSWLSQNCRGPSVRTSFIQDYHENGCLGLAQVAWSYDIPNGAMGRFIIPDRCSAFVDIHSLMKCSGILLLSFAASTRLVLAFLWICVQLQRRLILLHCALWT